ncbi:MAG: hypothetical protein NT075_13235 [Chloroflexi bacterium]|nr:hypothetical protein [Chloroflexota bacterium]
MKSELDEQKYAPSRKGWLNTIRHDWLVLLLFVVGLVSSLVYLPAHGAEIHAGTIPMTPNVYLPLISRAPTPTPGLSNWQQLGGADLRLSSLAFDLSITDNPRLYGGDLREANEGGGLYRANVASTCLYGQILARVNNDVRVLDLTFNDDQGLIGTFGDKVLYYERRTDSWQFTPSAMNANVYAVTFAGLAAYAGTDNGVFTSTDNGITWQAVGGPQNINTIQAHDDSLWIGADATGVYQMLLADHQLLPQTIDGLTGKALEVWSFVFNGDTVFVATSDGVYQGTTAKTGNVWRSFGRQGALVKTLALVDDVLYAGETTNGVWQKPLATGADWTPLTVGVGWQPNFTVLDLVYQSTLCGGGLFAATSDGIWVYGTHGQ